MLTVLLWQARIEVLQSELARVKSFLAAKAGDESLAAFLAAEKSGDVTYVESLKERLSCVARAPTLCCGLPWTLEQASGKRGHCDAVDA